MPRHRLQRSIDASPSDSAGELRELSGFDAPLRVASPATGRGPGVLVLPPGPARDDLLREACSRLARHGFVAVAPVIGKSVDAEPDVDGGSGDLERNLVDAAIEALFREPATDGARVGAIGFGRGAELALDAALRGARIATIVGFGGPLPTRETPSLEASVLALLGAHADAVEEGGADALAKDLRAEGLRFELALQPEVGEHFFDPRHADLYDAAAATAAWDAALARLRAEL